MESPPGNFVYGLDIYDKLIPVDRILHKINQQVDFSSVNEACKDLYSQDNGRPVKNLSGIMFRSAIVQYMNNYSDRDLEEAARYNLIVKWFIGIPVEDKSYDHSAPGSFRNRLGEKRWKKLFSMILKQIEDVGFARWNQSVDATHVIANIAIPRTIGLIRQGIKAMMEEKVHIKPKHAEMKRFHRMTRAKYWGLPKLNVQFIITTITANAKGLANVLNSVCYLKIC